MRARAATALGFLANGVGIGAWAAIIPSLRAGLALSDAALGLGLLALALGAMLAMPAAGWLGVRFGNHRVMQAAGFAFPAALCGPGLAASLPQLMVCTVLIGASTGVMDVAMNTHASTVERNWRAAIMSSFHAAFSLGGLLGAAGTGLLLAAGVAPSWALASVAALVAALMLGVVALGPGHGLGRGLGRGLGQEEAPERGGGFAWPNRALLGIGALAFLDMVIEGGMADWSGVFMATVAGASTAGATAGYAAFSLAMTGGRLVGDQAVRRLGGAAVLRLGGLGMVLGMALALGFASSAAALAGFALVGLGVANIIPVLFSAASRTGRVAPSVGVAMAAVVGYTGFLVGPPVIGLASDALGLRVALLFLLIAAAVIAVLGGRATRERRPAERGQTARA